MHSLTGGNRNNGYEQCKYRRNRKTGSCWNGWNSTGSFCISSTSSPAAAPAGAIPKTAHVAVLTEKEHFDIKEYPIPAIGDDDILVKVEGCGVCGTDAHEFKRDPFNLIPVALGHEGTGEIVAMGKNVKTDTAGKTS